MTYNQYVEEVHRVWSLHPEWRWGQAYFNVLVEHRPDLSEPIRTTELDPFYLDERMPAFMNEVLARW